MKCNITVVNKHQHKQTSNDIYIGRGSVLGNQFTHLPIEKSKASFQVKNRDEAIQCYRMWLKTQLEMKNTEIISELSLIKISSNSGINLVCFCKPKSCHGDVIKEFIQFSFDANVPIYQLYKYVTPEGTLSVDQHYSK